MNKILFLFCIFLQLSVFGQVEMKYNPKSIELPYWTKLMYKEDPDPGKVIEAYRSYYKKHTLINYEKSLYEQKYYNKFYSKLQEKLKSDKMVGDGIVPFISQQIPLLWINNNLDDINHLHCNVTIKRVTAGHKTILNNKDFLKLFFEIFI